MRLPTRPTRKALVYMNSKLAYKFETIARLARDAAAKFADGERDSALKLAWRAADVSDTAHALANELGDAHAVYVLEPISALLDIVVTTASPDPDEDGDYEQDILMFLRSVQIMASAR